MTDIYNSDYYKKFYEELTRILKDKSSNIKTVDLNWLEPRARNFGFKTQHGSYAFRSSVSSRMADKTVFLGGERVRLPNPLEGQKKIIQKAPEELEKILHILRTLPFIHLRRQMGDNSSYNPQCNLYVCIADPKNYRLAYMWGNTLFKPDKNPGPEFTMIHIPEEHQMRQQILSLPEYNLNIALGTDYMGEDKKGFLRQGMWGADEKGMLGLHAGSKTVSVRDAKDGKIRRYGVIIFGRTATGKSTWSCHQLGLDYNSGEMTQVNQDDIVFLKEDGSAFGSENGFYVKTDIIPTEQEAMYYALIDKTALLENVMVNAKGEIDFLDESLCGNGRSIVQRDKLRILRNNKLVGISAESINLPPLDELDGLTFAFITRRNTIMSFSQELTPEQATLAYLWGESTHSFATKPEKAGESVRIVGTDDFIVGSRARKVNKFYDIIMTLNEKYPGKVKCMQYNTGGVGEMIEISNEGSIIKKKMVRKTMRVPLDLMAAIQRGDLRGSNKYEKGILGTKDVTFVDGFSLDKYDVRKLYSNEQIQNYIKELVQGRREFTEEITKEGLRSEVLHAAERAFRIAKDTKTIVSMFTTEKAGSVPTKSTQDEQITINNLTDIQIKTRPRRTVGFRFR
jgi:phosphoenolpyruvate carboxykinase (ATP)